MDTLDYFTHAWYTRRVVVGVWRTVCHRHCFVRSILHSSMYTFFLALPSFLKLPVADLIPLTPKETIPSIYVSLLLSSSTSSLHRIVARTVVAARGSFLGSFEKSVIMQIFEVSSNLRGCSERNHRQCLACSIIPLRLLRISLRPLT